MPVQGQTGQLKPAPPLTIRSRIAPTPSGYLHLGNGFNFVLTYLLTRQVNGFLKLRIDDADGSRSRPEFIDDIFRQLEWLGIKWDLGPSGPDDFTKHYSQLHRLDLYQETLKKLEDKGHTYHCSCSRKEIRNIAPNGVYPGVCREQQTAAQADHAVRLLVPRGSVFTINGAKVALCESMGDFVLWRKDDLPSYQLASLCDDLEDRINYIVRGEDLRDSTAAQLFLADRLGAVSFSNARFFHHPLVTDNNSKKLSKSSASLSLQILRQQGIGPQAIYQRVADYLGLDTTLVRTLTDLEQLSQEQ